MTTRALPLASSPFHTQTTTSSPYLSNSPQPAAPKLSRPISATSCSACSPPKRPGPTENRREGRYRAWPIGLFNSTHGFLFLDKHPGPNLLSWPDTSPPYRVSDDLTKLLNKTNIRAQRMVHGIMEVVRELELVDDKEDDFRWVVMGDDDSIFFVDNMVDVLSFWWGWDNSKPKAGESPGSGHGKLSQEVVFLNSADNTTRACIADIGANLSPNNGNHQVDLRGDISGMLSSHSLSPLLSLHHLDKVGPIFPNMDRHLSTRHLMKAAGTGQSRLLQQTICHNRSYLQRPIETFGMWLAGPKPPFYLFNTRPRSRDPCVAPHVFFFEWVMQGPHDEVLTSYSRVWPRGMPACSSTANRSADYVQRIQVFSPAVKRTRVDRCECCDIIRVYSVEAEIRIRECSTDEIIA
ncbi:hypothetical protein STAS_00578 [Striga asiatica]|uniref:Uncharacterized protein n=1 Tax=Striga asiatica TaxID=4170 RepID=A0A5A7NX01_STRAF|nr:hypothetical protein STAS_00578 [Striga asiatica]